MEKKLNIFGFASEEWKSMGIVKRTTHIIAGLKTGKTMLIKETYQSGRFRVIFKIIGEADHFEISPETQRREISVEEARALANNTLCNNADITKDYLALIKEEVI